MGLTSGWGLEMRVRLAPILKPRRLTQTPYNIVGRLCETAAVQSGLI